MTNPEAIARMKLSFRKTTDLIRDFIVTGAIHDENIPTVRGWIMDELEKRDPDGFQRWLDQEIPTDESLRAYIKC